jgi:hypothetical protein
MTLLALNFDSMSLRDETSVRDSVEQAFRKTPESAILLTPGNNTISALWYFHNVENLRPDVIVIDENMFQFDWYRERLASRYPYLKQLEQDDLTGFVTENSMRYDVCRISLVDPPAFSCINRLSELGSTLDTKAVLEPGENPYGRL